VAEVGLLFALVTQDILMRLQAMKKVDRNNYVPEGEFAYEDSPQ
jgi:protein-L-isoaspartate O-methyltransferase